MDSNDDIFEWLKAQGFPLHILDTDLPILVTGETGVGKSQLARQIHNLKLGPQKPFVSLNLSSLHEGTFESTLFGAEKGAYSGAVHFRKGRIEEAIGGTLFLDEIGELTLSQQARLLELLEEKVFFRLGSTRPIRLNAKIIFATHRDLSTMVRNGQFREDLFFRICQTEIHLPSILDQKTEFNEIVQKCVETAARRWNKKISVLHEDYASLLEAYHWPGNYRELKSVIDYGVVTAVGSELNRNNIPNWFIKRVYRRPLDMGSSPNGDIEPEERCLFDHGRSKERALVRVDLETYLKNSFPVYTCLEKEFASIVVARPSFKVKPKDTYSKCNKDIKKNQTSNIGALDGLVGAAEQYVLLLALKYGLENNIPATKIREVLGVSKSRFYRLSGGVRGLYR